MNKQQPEKYVWIRSWGTLLEWDEETIKAMQSEASEDRAPINAIYKTFNVWNTTDDITNPGTLKELGLRAVPPVIDSEVIDTIILKDTLCITESVFHDLWVAHADYLPRVHFLHERHPTGAVDFDWSGGKYSTDWNLLRTLLESCEGELEAVLVTRKSLVGVRVKEGVVTPTWVNISLAPDSTCWDCGATTLESHSTVCHRDELAQDT